MDRVPEAVDVAAGDTVIGHNRRLNAHSAKADDDSWESRYVVVVEDQKWSRTFDDPGEYVYSCYPHPWKKGVIRVK